MSKKKSKKKYLLPSACLHVFPCPGREGEGGREGREGGREGGRDGGRKRLYANLDYSE